MNITKGEWMNTIEDVKSDIISIINDRQQVTYDELRSFATSAGVNEDVLKIGLKELEESNAIASRSSGGILTYYILQDTQLLRRIMVVEDDKNISKLMALSIGKAFDITQIYDGGEALSKIRFEKPDLVVLDLMLPGKDGLEICQEIKKDPQLNETVVIIVSAMDATSNRFKGIKNGADYYIKKPFDPDELRNLVTIFLKKKGKRFDPLIDLPNEAKISEALERVIKEKSDEYEIGRLRVEGLAEFAGKFTSKAGVTILRLASQLLQDNVREAGSDIFVGFLNSNDFVIAGNKGSVNKVVSEIKSDFNAVLPFVYQDEGYKPIELGIEDVYGAEKPKLDIAYTPIARDSLMKRREEVLKNKTDKEKSDIGSYTYEELRHMLGGEDLDVTITRDPDGVRLSVGKMGKKERKNS